MSNATVPTPQTDAESRVDQDLVARAYRKRLDRQELTAQERQALKKHEKNKEEQLRWQFYNDIPQKHWRAMSGRQTKVLNEQAERYGIPFGGAQICLPAVVRALHDFLAANAVRLAKEDDPLMQGNGSPALERYREERAMIARLERLERERNLLPRDEVREMLGRFAGIFRGAATTLQRQFGPAALEIFLEALDDAEREIERFFGGEDDSAGEHPNNDGASDAS